MRATGKTTESDGVHWPYSSMLFMGTFGTLDPAGRLYHRRSWLAVIGAAVLLVGIGVASKLAPSPVWSLATAAVLGGVFAYEAYAFWQYLLELDEMARQLQLEAVALTYGVGLVVVMFLTPLVMASDVTVNPAFFVALEPIRGIALAILARNYR